MAEVLRCGGSNNKRGAGGGACYSFLNSIVSLCLAERCGGGRQRSWFTYKKQGSRKKRKKEDKEANKKNNQRHPRNSNEHVHVVKLSTSARDSGILGAAVVNTTTHPPEHEHYHNTPGPRGSGQKLLFWRRVFCTAHQWSSPPDQSQQ